MNEELNTTATEQCVTTQEQITATSQPVTPTQAEQTQTTAVSVDMTVIEQKAQERAERAAQTVVRDMLKQSGLDDAAIQTMTAEWKSKQVTPEQTIRQLQGDLAERDAKITAYEQDKILRSYGLTDNDDIELYSIRVERMTAEGKDFEQAAAEYFKAHPVATPADNTAKPPMWGGAGTKPIGPSGLDEYKKMSGQEKIKLKQENPTLYEQFKKQLGF